MQFESLLRPIGADFRKWHRARVAWHDHPVMRVLALLVCLLGFGGSAGPPLLEVGPAPSALPSRAPRPLKLVTYNIRHAGGKALAELGDLLASDPELRAARIVGLQEVDRAKRRTGNVNTARVLAERLGMTYAWAGQPPRTADQDEEDTGIALLSDAPLVDVERIELPHAGPRGRRRVALAATVTIDGVPIRVAVVHAERRIPSDEHLDQYRTVVAALAARKDAARAVVLGDLNSHRFVDETESFFAAAGFRSAIPAAEPTLRFGVLKYRLDWIFLRGLTPTAGGVVQKVRLSDHRPMWTTVTLAP
jgi:endonuclease/exonuclease/phosphatase family metal-dependent hydrolase